MIPRRAVKIKIFLSVVIYVVKAAFMPFSAIKGNPANAGVTRLCGVSPCPVPDTATALPNQARYQLRYTRIFNFCHYTTAERKIKDFSVCGHLCGQSGFYAAFSNRGKSRKRRRRKALRRFASLYPGYNHGTPKPGAIPASLYPDIQLLPLYHGEGRKAKLFLAAVIYVCRTTIHIGQLKKKAMRDMVSCDNAELPHQLIRKRDHIPHGQENNTGHGLSAIPDEEHGELRLRVRQPVYPDYFTFRAAFSWSTRSVRSQVTPRSSRPMCP